MLKYASDPKPSGGEAKNGQEENAKEEHSEASELSETSDIEIEKDESD